MTYIFRRWRHVGLSRSTGEVNDAPMELLYDKDSVIS